MSAFVGVWVIRQDLGPSSFHRTVGLIGVERREHEANSVFRDLWPDVVVASVSGYLLMPWRMSNGRSRKPLECPSVAMLETSLESRMWRKPTVTQITKSYRRDTDFTGQVILNTSHWRTRWREAFLGVPISALRWPQFKRGRPMCYNL